ncbi:MAG: CoA-binding protein [Dehalococcoidales bacterium]|nr:CoA-binding protein [Dehalococcoidales bacterium]
MELDFTRLDRAFNPKCVVVVGDKQEGDFRWLRAQRAFKGKLYSVQVSPKSIEGIKKLGIENFTSLMDIPGDIDLVICAVPRTVSVQILEDCIRKKVGAAHFFTSGFSETGTAEGKKMEAVLREKSHQAGFPLIGPNCMGIFNPKIGIKQTVEQYTGTSGQIGFISQSGTHAIFFSLEAHLQGMDISKSVSFGNGIVLDSADYLEYLGHDPETKAIGMYLEGIKDGKRFLKVLREVSRRKPVVIWKGGRTEAGGRAIASHTGSLAVPQAVWDSAIRQCGAINVDDMDELIDTLKALIYLPPVKGARVAVAGGSGGQSVAIADDFGEAGLAIPLLTRQSYDELSTFFSLVGGSYRNPVDTGNPNSKEVKRIMEILARDANIDSLILMISTHFITMGFATDEDVNSQVSLMADIRDRFAKPVMAIVSYSTPRGMEQARSVTKKFQTKGIPAFPSTRRSAIALRKVLDYYRRRGGNA